MNILDMIAGALSLPETRAVKKPTYPSFLGREADFWSDKRNSPERRALQSSWVYSNAQHIAGILSGAAFQVKRIVGEDVEDVGNHEFEQRLRKPNDFMTRSFFMGFTAASMAIRGEAYWYLARAGKYLLELWPVPCDKIAPIKDKANYVSGYEYRAFGKSEIIPVERICWFRNPHPFDQWEALSPIGALRLAVDGDLNAQAWNANFWGPNNATPSSVISLPQTTSDTDFDRIETEIKRDFQAINRRTMITRAGDIDVKMVGISQKDAEFLASRSFARDEIDRVMLGASPDKFDSEEGVKAIDRRIKDHLWPVAVYVGEQMTASIIQPLYGDDMMIEPEDFRPQDRALAVQEYTIYSADRTINENRKEQKLEPVTDPLADIPVRLLDPNLGAVASQQSPPSMAGSQAPEAAQVQEEQAAAKSDLLRWRKKALRLGGACDFESKAIPAAVLAQVRGGLVLAGGQDDIERVFDGAIKALAGGDDTGALVDALRDAARALREARR